MDRLRSPRDHFLQVHGVEGDAVSERPLPEPEDVLHREIQTERDQLQTNRISHARLASQPFTGLSLPNFSREGGNSFKRIQVPHLGCQGNLPQRRLHLLPAGDQSRQHQDKVGPARSVLRETTDIGTKEDVAEQKRG